MVVSGAESQRLNSSSFIQQGTKEERKRICVPFPFELSMSNAEALGDFEIHVEGWKNFAYYSPGDSLRR